MPRRNRSSYDVHVLAQRFNAGFEQVCHRLTTLQRPNARGVPFFLLRVDNAGNVSKRFSSGTFPFSKFGGTCPLWNVHSTFDTPDRLLKQIIELPDGVRYFSIAQMVRRPVAPHPQPQPRFAIGLGLRNPPRRQAGLRHRHGSGKSRGHADRRQLPALRTRKLQPARRAADHADVDSGREHAAGVVVRVQQCAGVVSRSGAKGRLAQTVILRESGVSSTPQLLGSIIDVSEYWIARFRGRRRKGTPSLRAQRSNPFSREERMDCFAALAMTARYSSAFSRRDAPELCMIFRPNQRAWATQEGAGNAGCPLHPQPRVQR